MAQAPDGTVNTMSQEQTEQTMRDYINALINAEDFASFYADDVLWTTMESGHEVRGRDHVRALVTSLNSEAFRAAPELRRLVCGDGIAAVEACFVARHVGEFAGIPATGAQVRVPYTTFYQLDGDRIVALRAYLSMNALVAQLQAARSSTAAT